MPDMTPKQEVADHRLGGTLDDFVRTRRDAGRSWRQISNDLRDQTKLDITYETLRVWYGTPATDAA